MKILIMENEQADLEYLIGIVEECGHEVECADRDRGWWKTFSATTKGFDFVVTGTGMTGFKNYDLIKRVLAKNADQRIVMIGGDMEEDYAWFPHAIRSKVDFLPRAFNPHELEALIN
nr:hypothetical protein [Desulfobulbaceae bacterium]